jgi:hypothetical protein
MINAIYDTETKQWNVTEVAPIFSHYTDIKVGVVANGVLPANLKGKSIYISSCDTISGTHEVGLPVIATRRFPHLPDTITTITFICDKVKHEFTFTTIKPEKPLEGDYTWSDERKSWVPSDAYLEKLKNMSLLVSSDAKMARAFEDLVSLLGVEENLPQVVKDNLANRRELRSKIAGNI